MLFKIKHKRRVYGSISKYYLIDIKLAYMLRTYNLTVRFSKYEFNNNLLNDIILPKVTLGVT